MTLSNNDQSKLRSISKNASESLTTKVSEPSNDNFHNDDAHDNRIHNNELEASKEQAQEPLVKPIENLVDTDIDIDIDIDTDTDTEDQETASAQYPESKITMESVSPDIVIASLETSEPNPQTSSSPSDVEPNENNNAQDNLKTASPHEQYSVQEKVSAQVNDAEILQNDALTTSETLAGEPITAQSANHNNEQNGEVLGKSSSAAKPTDLSKNLEINKTHSKPIDAEASTATTSTTTISTAIIDNSEPSANTTTSIDTTSDDDTTNQHSSASSVARYPNLIEDKSQSSADISSKNTVKEKNYSGEDEDTESADGKPGDKQSGDKQLPKKKQRDEPTEEEKVKKVKEAKLESYKQFVAEQFSNQKVDYPEVRVRIEANALPSKMYFIMNILSAIIASYGLVTNSAAVVIGAMLVAMMLGPITGVALAVIDHRMPLLRKSLFTVAAGVSLVVLVGFIIGLLHNDQPLTAEILSRTQPTSMDLMIALAGGTAGAYAMVSPHLSVAVVGVAVATALVPPLAASGILFANGEMTLGAGALLLAITNITAIQFTNALVLWLLGFRRLVDDDYKSNTYMTFLRRNAVTLLLLAGLGSYLTINLNKNAKQQTFESTVKETINSYFIDKGNVLTNTQFDKANDNQIVRAVIRGETTPSSYDVRQIESIITQEMEDNFPGYLPIKLQLRYLPVQVIESNPLIADKLDETDAAILTN